MEVLNCKDFPRISNKRLSCLLNCESKLQIGFISVKTDDKTDYRQYHPFRKALSRKPNVCLLNLLTSQLIDDWKAS